jgi:hypothetical protein
MFSAAWLLLVSQLSELYSFCLISQAPIHVPLHLPRCENLASSSRYAFSSLSSAHLSEIELEQTEIDSIACLLSFALTRFYHCHHCARKNSSIPHRLLSFWHGPIQANL